MATMLLDDGPAARTAGTRGTGHAYEPLEPVVEISVLPWLYPWFLAMGGILMTLALIR